jgi:hypothetical protein
MRVRENNSNVDGKQTYPRASHHSIGSLDQLPPLIQIQQMHSPRPARDVKREKKRGGGVIWYPEFACPLSCEPSETSQLTTPFEELDQEVVVNGVREIPTEEFPATRRLGTDVMKCTRGSIGGS